MVELSGNLHFAKDQSLSNSETEIAINLWFMYVYAILLGNNLDHEIENLKESNPTFFINFTSSCEAKNIPIRTENDFEFDVF